MQSSQTESTKGPIKHYGFIRIFLIAALACIIVLALIIGGLVAYLTYSNPKLLQGDPKALMDTRTILESAGIKPSNIPTTVTSQQEACAVSKLGQQRVNEIKAGSAITPADIASAGSCF